MKEATMPHAKQPPHKDEGMFNLKYLSAFVIALGAIVAPFIAMGGYKEKIERIGIDQAAQASEIRTHERDDTQTQLAMTAALSTLNESIKNLNLTMNDVKTGQQNIWHKIAKEPQ